jgi:hypothetical protein
MDEDEIESLGTDVAVAMMTLVVNHRAGHWLEDDEPRFHEMWDEAEVADGGEGLVLTLLNAVHHALIELHSHGGPTPAEWLQRFALDYRSSGPAEGT